MAFELSYAGIPLCVPTPEVREWLDAALSLLDLRDVQPPQCWPGKNTTGLAWSNPTTYPTPRVGQLFWPSNASRWAVGHFLADGGMVQRIKALTVQTNFTSADLILRCDDDPEQDNQADNAVIAKMHLLPPRPLGGFNTPIDQTGAATDFYLLTLVDIRYFWQWVPVSFDGGTEDSPKTWADLYAAIAAELGVALSYGSIDAKYGKPEPDSSLFANKENAALLLDAALANTGRVLTAKYDGTFGVDTITDAVQNQFDTRELWKDDRHAGGPALNLDTATTDTFRKAILPATVYVTFPKWVTDSGYYKPDPQYRGWALNSYNAVYTSEVDMTALSGYSQYVGTSLTWAKTFHDTAKAIYPDDTAVTDGDDPDNKTDLDNLAEQLAKDYADALIVRMDEVYPGIVPWTPDGLNDLLFLYQADRNQTRIQGRPWNDGVSEMQHGFGPLPNPSDGFWAIITELPVVDDSGSGSGDIGCSGSGDADSPTADCADGYGWKEAVNDSRFPGCGILAEPEPNLRSGTRCRRQAFEVNGRIDVPLFTRVWLKKQTGFDTYLFVAPAIASRDDPGGGFWAQLDSAPPESGSGAGSELEGIYCAPEAGKVSQRPGYAWQEIMSEADGESWVVRLGNFGTHCHKQAYEINNFDAPVFVTDQDGFDHPTRVWMRLAPVDPDYRLGLALAGLSIPDTYVFEFRAEGEGVGGSGGGSGFDGPWTPPLVVTNVACVDNHIVQTKKYIQRDGTLTETP